MNQQLSAKAANFQDFLSSRGIEEKVVELSESTRTSAEAAAAIGCEVEEIAKSIVFYVKDTLRPILVIASGTNRVDEKKLKKLVGGKLKRADADFVREVTGFVIGGVPPAGHIEPLQTFMDLDLLQFSQVWAAAGSPYAVFPIKPQVLLELCTAEAVDIKVNSSGQKKQNPASTVSTDKHEGRPVIRRTPFKGFEHFQPSLPHCFPGGHSSEKLGVKFGHQ